MSRVKDALTVFKLHVASIEFNGDTLALDRALAASSELLYDTRRAIDAEWAEVRHKGRRVIHTLNLYREDYNKAAKLTEAEEQAILNDLGLGKDTP